MSPAGPVSGMLSTPVPQQFWHAGTQSPLATGVASAAGVASSAGLEQLPVQSPTKFADNVAFDDWVHVRDHR